MLRCRELVHRVTRDDLGSLPLRERIAIGMHLMMCRHCRAYVRSLKRLRVLARAIWGDIPALDPDRLARLRDRLRAELG